MCYKVSVQYWFLILYSVGTRREAMNMVIDGHRSRDLSSTSLVVSRSHPVVDPLCKCLCRFIISNFSAPRFSLSRAVASLCDLHS